MMSADCIKINNFKSNVNSLRAVIIKYTSNIKLNTDCCKVSS